MILLILILSLLDIAASNEITLHKGSFTLQSYSTSNTTNIQIPYMICFRSLPAYVYATVTPTDQSLPHNFTLNVEEIRENSFIAEMIRTDGVNNWDTTITVKWTLFLGNGIGYKNKFIWLPTFHGTHTLDYPAALGVCRDLNATLVDITDAKMYDSVYQYVTRNFIFDKGYVNVWIGLVYDATTGKVYQSNGQLGYYGSFHPGNPVNDLSKRHMVIGVRPPGSLNTDRGMWNSLTTHRDAEALCQTLIE